MTVRGEIEQLDWLSEIRDGAGGCEEVRDTSVAAGEGAGGSVQFKGASWYSDEWDGHVCNLGSVVTSGLRRLEDLERGFGLPLG